MEHSEQPARRSAQPTSINGIATFSTGRVKIHPEHVHGSRLPSLAWILLSPTWGAWRPIHVFVIEHASGLVLFDSGQDRASVTDRDYYPSSPIMRLVYHRLAQFEMGPEETVSAQLATLGYRPQDVRWVVLSHLHQDHIGGLRELTGARFVVSITEWDAMQAPRAEMAGFLPRHTDLPGQPGTRLPSSRRRMRLSLHLPPRTTCSAMARSSCSQRLGTPPARCRCSSTALLSPFCSSVI